MLSFGGEGWGGVFVSAQGRFWNGLGHLAFVYTGWILGHFTSHHQITLIIFLETFFPTAATAGRRRARRAPQSAAGLRV